MSTSPFAARCAAANLTPQETAAARDWLCNLLIRDDRARLDEAGDGAERRLSETFWDLPAEGSEERGLLKELLGMPWAGEGPPRRTHSRRDEIIDMLSAAACGMDLCVEPGEAEAPPRLQELEYPGDHPDAHLYACELVGGPGQGKSTLGLAASALHRCRLLEGEDLPLPAHQQAERWRSHPFYSSLAEACPGLPLRLSAVELARSLSSGQSSTHGPPWSSVYEHLGMEPEAVRAELGVDVVRRLAEAGRCIVILDGFDEVGSAHDRINVMKAVQGALHGLSHASVSSTWQLWLATRPHGYHGELALIAGRPCRRTLRPLTPKEGLDFAEHMLADDPRRQELVTRLRPAAEDPGMAPLLSSPLQVALLARVVRTRELPRDRYALFEEHLKVVYEREAGRPTWAAALLRERKDEVLRLHHDTALRLQARSEAPDAVRPGLPDAEVQDALTGFLRESEVEEAASVARLLVRACRERLVLMTEPEPGHLGFSLRSTQEFLAARGLIQEQRDLGFHRRLGLELVPRPIWRQTLQFLVQGWLEWGRDGEDILLNGPCAEAEHGAALATELYPLARKPAVKRRLLDRACGLVGTYYPRANEQLGALLSDAQFEAFRSQLERALRDTENPAGLHGAWTVLFYAMNEGHLWPMPMGAAAWADTRLPARILNAAWRLGPIAAEWAAERMWERPEGSRPGAVLWIRRKGGRLGELQQSLRPLMDPRYPDPNRSLPRTEARGVTRGHEVSLDFRPYPTPSQGACSPRHTPDTPTWRAWARAADHCECPNPRTLAAALDAMADLSHAELAELQGYCPSVLFALAGHIQDRDHAQSLALAAAGGHFGTLEDWRTWEASWSSPAGERPTARIVVWAPGTVPKLSSEELPIHLYNGSIAQRVREPVRPGLPEWQDLLWTALVDGRSISSRAIATLFLRWARRREVPDAARVAHAVSIGDRTGPVFRHPAWTSEEWQSVQAAVVKRWPPREAPPSRLPIGSPELWTSLGLPGPPPLQPPPPPPEPLPSAPVCFDTLKVTDLRGVPSLELKLALPEAGHGQWVVLLGNNGTGKTTLLRAIALALRDPTRTEAWPGLDPAQFLRIGGKGDARVEIDGPRGQWVAGVRRAEGDARFVASRPDGPVLPVFGYGARRGSALGGPDRAVQLDPVKGVEIATLFEEHAHLVHATSWLSGLQRQSLLQPATDATREAGQLYQRVIAALTAVLGAEHVEFSTHLLVTLPGQPPVPLDWLSDGYITTAGWFIDLLARWLELARRSGVRIRADAPLEQMTGVVLLDEIDLHLHPTWQIEAIHRARRLLPRMTFFVTTHNPAAVVGARPEEIWVLRRDGDAVTAEQHEVPPTLLTAGEILRTYFGMDRLYPSELGEKLDRYLKLADDPYRTDEEQAEVERLEQELSAAGVPRELDILPRERPR